MSTIQIAGAPKGTYNKVKTLLATALGGHDAYAYAKAPDSTFTFDANSDQAVHIKEEVGKIDGAVLTLTEAAPEPEPAPASTPEAPSAPAASASDLPPFPPPLAPGMTPDEIQANREALAAALAARRKG